MNSNRNIVRVARLSLVFTSALALLLATLTAQASGPQISVASQTAVSGGPLNVGGSGWAPYDNVRYQLTLGNSQAQLCSLQADSTGAIAIQTCSIPTYIPAGKYSVDATDGTTGASAKKPVTVGPTFTLLGSDGSVTNVGASGQTITVSSGSGYAAGSRVSATVKGKSVAFLTPVTTNSEGGFNSAMFRIPKSKGTATVKITDASHHSAQALLTVFNPTIKLNSKSGAAGNPLLIAGANWQANDGVSVSLVSGVRVYQICRLTASSTGAIVQQSCALPTFAPEGLYTVSANDNSMQIALTKPFKLAPSIAVTINGTPSAGAFPGSIISVSGSGFAAGSSVASMTLGSKKLAFTPTVAPINTNGAFSSVTFKVPKIATKAYTLTVRDAAGNKATARFSVT